MADLSKAPAFQFYAKDWVSDGELKAMSLSRQGAFIRLLAYQWIEGKLPADVRQIGKMCDISPNSLVKMWEQLDHFFPLLECKSARANPRLAAQRKALEEKRLSLSAAGKKGAEKTWGGHRPGHGTAVAVAVSSTTAGTGTPRQNTENLESPATPAELKPIFDRPAARPPRRRTSRPSGRPRPAGRRRLARRALRSGWPRPCDLRSGSP